MSDDDKPFACTTPECGMRFANEDHLIVHMKKHDMCLALNTGSNTLSPNHLFLDQTPTPTKFLKNCEEIGLFQELSKNPFEEAFKKASDVPPFGPGEGHVEGASTTKNGHAQIAPLPGPQPHGPSFKGVLPGPAAALPGPHSNHSGNTLNTPSTTAVADTPTIVQRSEPEPSKASMETGKSPEPQRSAGSTASNQPTSTTSDDEVIIISNTQAADSSTPTTKTPPITTTTSSPVIIRLDQPPPPATSANLPASVVVPHPQYTMQVLLQLPTGQTVPVQIPAAISSPGIHVTAMPMAPTHAPATIAKSSPSPPVITLTAPPSQTQPSLAKQKLKAALQQNTQQNAAAVAQNQSKLISSSSTSSSTSSPPTAVPLSTPLTTSLTTGCATIKTVLQSGLQTLHMAATASSSSSPHSTTLSMLEESNDSSFMDMDSMVGSPDSLDSVSIGGIKRKREDGDPDDRRRKFLERNRAAAARCRQRRKQWITNLEKKAEELQNTNSRLQGEVNLLRNEVAQLKTLLLAHKDCPITLQQKSQGQFSIQTVSMPVVNSVVIDSSDVAAAEAIATSALTNMAQGAILVEAAASPRVADNNTVVIGHLPASFKPKKEPHGQIHAAS